jgi:HK97 family phage portal protein
VTVTSDPARWIWLTPARDNPATWAAVRFRSAAWQFTPTPNSEGFIKFAYSGNSTIFTIINLVSRKFAYMPRYLYQVKDPNAMRMYKHYLKDVDSRRMGVYKEMKDRFNKAYDTPPASMSGGMLKLSMLMERPNPEMAADIFFQTIGAYYETLGEAIIWCNRGTDENDLPNVDGEVLEMWPLPPQYMEIIPDPLNVWGSLGWVFNVAGKRIPIDDENIIHWRQPNLNFDGVNRQHMRGMSPLRPGNKKLTEDESATDASVALNQNEGAKGVLYDASTPSVPMTPQRETNIRNAVDRKVNNRDMRGAVATLSGLWGYLDMSMSSTDMELETRKDNIFDRLCNLFGVPADLFKTGQTYQNVLQARKDLITNKILPSTSSLNAELDRVLMPAFGLNPAKVTIDCDATMITELQDDMAAKVTSLNTAWWMTPNEKRKEMDQPESEEEGADSLWISNTQVKMEDAAQPMDTVDSFGASGALDTSGDDPVPPKDPAPAGKPPSSKPPKSAAGGKNK